MQNINVAVIIAHPDDEVLWAGGLILKNPAWRCFIISMCRKYNSDRAPKFYKSLEVLNAGGIMGNLDDGRGELPIGFRQIKQLVLDPARLGDTKEFAFHDFL